jgi:hypothetical protein
VDFGSIGTKTRCRRAKLSCRTFIRKWFDKASGSDVRSQQVFDFYRDLANA